MDYGLSNILGANTLTSLYRLGGTSAKNSGIADALPLRILRHLPSTGGLHTLEDGVLGEMLGRGRFALLHLDRIHRQRLALCQTVRQGGVFGGGGIDPPAHVQHRFSFGGEAMPATLRRQAGFGVPMGRADRPEQPQRHQPQDFPLSLGERGEVGIGGAFGGDNGMVVCDVLRACLISSDEDGNEGESKNLSRNNKFTLTIFPKPAEFVKPPEKALYHPAARQNDKLV